MSRSSRVSPNIATSSAVRVPAPFRSYRLAFLVILATLSFGLGLAVVDAQAKPQLGDKPVGKQSKAAAAQRKAQATLEKNAQAPLPAMNVAAVASVPAATSVSPSAPRWFAPLAGVAAGIGLSALASHFGFAEEIGAFLAFMLLLTAIMLVIRFAVLPRRGSGSQQFFTPNYSYAGVGEEAVVAQQYTSGSPALTSYQQVAVVRPNLPDRSNDAGSRWRIPSDFDVEVFLRQAKSQYVRLQAAHDNADLEQLRDFTSPDLFEQIRQEIQSERVVQRKTDIIGLKAELLGISDEPTEHMACVRFQGFLREQTALVGEPFDEVWNLTKSVDGSSGWLLAGVQQLDTVH